MKQIFDGIVTFACNDLFTGYALYTVAFVIWTFFRKPGRMLSSWDDSANLLVRYAGVFVFFHSLFALISFDMGSDMPFMPFDANPWVQLVVWLVASQLLWVKTFRQHRLLRIFIAIALFFSFEKFVIIVTSLHRDYLPSSWESDAFPYGLWVAITLALITKAVTFVVFAYVLTYLRSRFAPGKINQE